MILNIFAARLSRRKRGELMSLPGTVKDPFLSFNFLVEINGTVCAGFSGCTGLEAAVAPVDAKRGTSYPAGMQLPEHGPVSTITLKRGVAADGGFPDWIERPGGSKEGPGTLVLILLDESRRPAMKWHIQRCRITKISSPVLYENNRMAHIEEVELVCESIETEIPQGASKPEGTAA